MHRLAATGRHPEGGRGARCRIRGCVRAAATATAALLLIPLAGCEQGLGGGAATVPTVRIVVEPQEGEAAAEEETVEVAGYGTFTGRVVLQGTRPNIPSRIPPVIEKDSAVCVRAEIPDETLIVDEASGGIQNVFVYLPRKPPGTPAELTEPPAEPVMFDQKTCTFTPHALVLQAGQEMRVLNSDPIVHNTHTNPTANEVFNQAIRASETDGLPFVYARPEREPVRVVCDFHAWMLAWHLPLDHPYGTVTAADGSFTISEIPAGSHRFTVWHEGKKLMDYPVTINPDETTTVEIPIDGASLAELADPRRLRTVVFSR